MSRDQASESVTSSPQDVAGALDTPGQPEQFPAWLDSRQAMRRVGNKSLKGWREWRKRHGIGTDSRGRVSLVELEAALLRKRRPGRPAGKPRVMAAASLANLRHGGVPPSQSQKAR